MKAKMTFEVNKIDAMILANADDLYNALFQINEIALRERRKDEHTKKQILEKILSEIPDILMMDMWWVIPTLDTKQLKVSKIGNQIFAN